MFAFLLQIHDAAHALHGRGAKFAFGHSCELESPMLKAGCWRLDLLQLPHGDLECFVFVCDFCTFFGLRKFRISVTLPVIFPWPSALYDSGCGGSVGFLSKFRRSYLRPANLDEPGPRARGEGSYTPRVEVGV